MPAPGEGADAPFLPTWGYSFGSPNGTAPPSFSSCFHLCIPARRRRKPQQLLSHTQIQPGSGGFSARLFPFSLHCFPLCPMMGASCSERQWHGVFSKRGAWGDCLILPSVCLLLLLQHRFLSWPELLLLQLHSKYVSGREIG